MELAPKLILAGIMLAAAMAAAHGQAPPSEPGKMQFVEEIERIDLPDGPKWYTVLVSSPGKASPFDSWFESDERLRGLKQSTEWRRYESTSPVFRSHLAAEYGNDFPMVVIQAEDGAMRAQLGGTVLKQMTEPGQLVAALDYAAQTLRPIEKRSETKVGLWPFNRRPRPNPSPCPDGQCPLPPAPVEPSPAPEPDPTPTNPPATPRKTPIADALITILGPNVAPWANGFNLSTSAVSLAGLAGALWWKRRQSRKA